MKGLISWNPRSGKNGRYELVSEINTTNVLTRSKYLTKLIAIVQNQEPLALKAKLDSYSIISRDPQESHGIVVTGADGQVIDQDATVDELRPKFTINEKFEFMGTMIDMVIDKRSASLLITGRGGIGKTWTVLKRLESRSMVNADMLVPNISDLHKDAIVASDTEEQIEAKALAEIDRPKGDYVVIKGRVTPKALYRVLFENRKRLIIFDDCDFVLLNDDCNNLLKTALDNYQDRYISWRTEMAFGESDLPQSFKFEGSMIFISNLPMSKIDEAFRTRPLKVDVSMSTDQRLERMRAVLDGVMPDVDLKEKEEALEVLEENKNLTDDINFRSLMNTITFRTSGNPDWKRIATFSLLEQ